MKIFIVKTPLSFITSRNWLIVSFHINIQLNLFSLYLASIWGIKNFKFLSYFFLNYLCAHTHLTLPRAAATSCRTYHRVWISSPTSVSSTYQTTDYRVYPATSVVGCLTSPNSMSPTTNSPIFPPLSVICTISAASISGATNYRQFLQVGASLNIFNCQLFAVAFRWCVLVVLCGHRYRHVTA